MLSDWSNEVTMDMAKVPTANQGGQMGDFIAQIKILGDILVLWAIKCVNKNAKKAQISVFGRYLFLCLCSKVCFWVI